MLAMRRRLGLERINLLAVLDPRTGAGVGEALLVKCMDSAFYCFGGLNHASAISVGAVSAPGLARQVEDLLAAGCDGVKLIESKPTCRKRLPHPLDGDYYAGFFARAEELNVPILWHVGDPVQYWGEASLLPKWALDRGWDYDGTYVTNEQHYQEVEAVLTRHPKLRVVFAHFLFLYDDLPRAGEFLADHPSVSLDLSPGIELLFNLPGREDQTREFFIVHQDRILLGTDLTERTPHGEADRRIARLARYLETDEDVRFPYPWKPGSEAEVRGLGLPDDVLAKIYHANFEALAGSEARPVAVEQAVSLCRGQAEIAAAMSGTAAADTEAGRYALAIESQGGD